jgi:amino acid adenylation domain-containing protein
MLDGSGGGGLSAGVGASSGVESFASIAARVWRHAADRPGAAAILWDGGQVTFAQLVSLASVLAASFGKSAGANTAPIAVATNNSVQMIAAALAAWKMGCAYLPVDPLGPPERLRHMLAEARVSLVAVNGSLEGRIPAGPWGVADIDACGTSCAGAATFAAQTSVPVNAAGDLAYIVYTSGSTGQPKGVAVTHGNLTNLIRWYKKAFEVTEADRGSQFSALTFDAAVLETWPILSAGASLHILAPSIALASEQLRDALVSRGITLCFAATPIAEQLLALEWPDNTKLRYLLTGADVLHTFPPATLPFRLVNNYGPTECTVLVTSGTVPTHSPYRVPTLGRPIAGANVYILDANLSPAPDGESGEICIAGEPVSAGYSGRPDLTADRFVDNPFGAPGSKLYRTGDLGRKLPGGELEFRGRLDEQIKIRGYRIEPGEIVGALRSHAAVSAAAVTAIESGMNKSLAAYVVLRSQVSGAELRSHLVSRLPSYMVPQYLVRLDSMPVTGHGKIDKLRLPAPGNSDLLEPVERSAEPESEIQAEMASILSVLLEGRPVGLHDNFFRLGGHSLLAAQVIARVRNAFGVELPLRTVFESPTVAELSDQIEKRILDIVASRPSGERADSAAQ